LVQGDKFKSLLVRAFQYHGRCHTSRKGLFPPQGAQAPFIAMLQSFESVLRPWCHQIVALLESEIQEILRDAGANDMASMVLMVCLAAAISEKTCKRVIGTGHQFSTQHIEGLLTHGCALSE
jgi:hypothetical protein